MAGQRQTPGFAIEGMSKVEANLAKAVAEMEASSLEAIMAVAYGVVNQAKLFCPVDTGNLRASIDILEQDPATKSVVVGTTVGYAPYVEYGTEHTPAQPFMRPALHVQAASMQGEVAAIIRHAIKAA